MADVIVYFPPLMGASGGVMVCKLDLQTFINEFESHQVLLSYGLVPHLSKKKNRVNYYFPPLTMVILKPL